MLKDHHPATLKIIAEFWGVAAEEVTPESIMQAILSCVASAEGRQEVIDTLPPQAKHAWNELNARGGEEKWAVFSRSYGEIRPMGASRLEREKPQLDPVNVSEILWYRGLLGKMFKDQRPEPQEIAYIPEELLFPIDQTLPVRDPISRNFDSRKIIPSAGLALQALNDLTTILAACRAKEPSKANDMLFHPESFHWMMKLLSAHHLISPGSATDSTKIRQWFGLDPGEMLASLADTWYSSEQVDELRLLPEIECEGSWKNDPRPARIQLWNLIRSFQREDWIPVAEFIDHVHKVQPDFVRPAGNYDLWLIRDNESHEHIRGFESWYKVEGRLIQLVLTSILPSLNLLELGQVHATQQQAFRWSAWGRQYLLGQVNPLEIPEPRNTLRSQGDIRIEQGTPFAQRYHLSRFCKWIKLQEGVYQYRITLADLQTALKSGMEIQHIQAILGQVFGQLVPPSLSKALHNLEKTGCLIRAEKLSLLRVENSQLLDEIMRSDAARFIGERLSPTAAEIRKNAEKQLGNAILELGFFSDFQIEV